MKRFGAKERANSARRDRRVPSGVAAVVVVGVGLLVHFVATGPLADFLADALYAVLIYLLVTLFFPRMAPIASVGMAYGVCAFIEVCQLTGGPAALAAAFPPSRLVLGTTFSPVDLAAYAVGVLAAFGADLALTKRFSRKTFQIHEPSP